MGWRYVVDLVTEHAKRIMAEPTNSLFGNENERQKRDRLVTDVVLEASEADLGVIAATLERADQRTILYGPFTGGKLAGKYVLQNLAYAALCSRISDLDKEKEPAGTTA